MDKENEALKEKIEFTFKMEILDISFISEIDLITIFGNIYDNAIEANKENNSEKFIRTAIYKIGEMLVIRIENSCNNTLEYDGSRIKSTKKNHKGIGMNNIKEAVKKYNGIFQIYIVKRKCRVIISIPIKFTDK
ncbi:MAG: GHKL domain-containing protein [Thomasclavelia sp.]